MSVKVYRVVKVNGADVSTVGRGSDPFTNKSSAKRRATQLTNQHKMCGGAKFKVQEADVEWKDLDE